MKRTVLLANVIWLSFLTLSLSAQTPSQATATARTTAIPSRPFPQHTHYLGGSILPNHVSRDVLDDSVRSFYRQWKKHYVLPGCTEGEAYVWFEGTKGDNICVSEGQGYGMMITALMAGFDSTAQQTYDQLFRYYKSHPSTSSPHLMAWIQSRECRSIDGGTATDGDMDIAYSLLIADAQWGRQTNIPYRQEALAMIAAIKREEINPITYIVMEANGESPHSRDYYDMRSSDFMPEHIRSFRAITGDSTWDSVLNNNYRLFHYLQDTYSPEVGLVPDFIKQISLRPGQGYTGNSIMTSAHGAGDDEPNTRYTGTITAVPAQPNYLESKYDGLYNFNACRVPWRIAADYLVSGDKRAAEFLAPINAWIRTTTKGNPDNISAGYDLSGTDLPHRYFEALCFICPFAVSAMASHENQEWLNKLWDYIIRFKLKDFDYYDNSIKMIDLIILSGNYWAPLVPDSSAATPAAPAATPTH
ncbi:glycosyl hydrolase family 8 [Puia sp.]|uniref:glycosyl hydrolase family 8 n=1 Tax=Puia sp. TaxID=2045100 RepID=UPI002F41FF27